MFTGIIETIAQLSRRDLNDRGQRLEFRPHSPEFLDDVKIGDSIAVNGVCTTVTQIKRSTSELGFTVDISPETLERTTLGDLPLEALCNLEKPLRVGDRLGGHWVQGHIDSFGKIVSVTPFGDFHEVVVRVPKDLSRFFIEKGSVAIDGVSLTINRLADSTTFTDLYLMLIPHTWNQTNFNHRRRDDRVNIEVDMLGKYFERRQNENLAHP